MSDPTARPISTHEPIATGVVTSDAGRAAEPIGARIVGGAAGALTFFLCALWLGPKAGIAMSVVGAVAALALRRSRAAILFVTTAVLSALALLLPTTLVLLCAALAAGAGLISAAHDRRAADVD